MKTGWKTTEFWMALISQVIALLVLLGVIARGEASNLEAAVSNVMQATFALVANAIVVWQYIRSRTAIKQADPPK